MYKNNYHVRHTSFIIILQARWSRSGRTSYQHRFTRRNTFPHPSLDQLHEIIILIDDCLYNIPTTNTKRFYVHILFLSIYCYNKVRTAPEVHFLDVVQASFLK